MQGGINTMSGHPYGIIPVFYGHLRIYGLYNVSLNMDPKDLEKNGK